MFSINYCEGASGRKPVEEFVNSLDTKLRAKVFGQLELLEKYGPALGMPFSRHLDDGIFELRTAYAGKLVRVLFFFDEGGRIVLTHGFVKKTRKTPLREVDRAKRLRADWRKRNEREE